jgi:hypothetical protein
MELKGPKPRQALAAWLTADENEQFARAIVNRMWAHFLGAGFVEPIDDFRRATRRSPLRFSTPLPRTFAVPATTSIT